MDKGFQKVTYYHICCNCYGEKCNCNDEMCCQTCGLKCIRCNKDKWPSYGDDTRCRQCLIKWHRAQDKE